MGRTKRAPRFVEEASLLTFGAIPRVCDSQKQQKEKRHSVNRKRTKENNDQAFARVSVKKKARLLLPVICENKAIDKSAKENYPSRAP